MVVLLLLTACHGPSGSDKDDPGDSPPPSDAVPLPEACDGADADQDGLVDCDDPECRDLCDGDGDGADAISRGGDDCNDGDPEVHPDATEICDGIDNDCDDETDDDDPDLDPPGWYADNDGDSYGDAARVRFQCDEVFGAVLDGTDCDDTRPEINPAATEVCGNGDDNCDNLVDDDDPALDLGTAETWYADVDGDEYGDDLSTVVACDRPANHVRVGGDCDDLDPAVFEEVPWLADGDGDGVGVDPATAPTCHPPGAGYAPDTGTRDCDDVDPTVHPGAHDDCDDLFDADCDGLDCRPCTEIKVGLVTGWAVSTQGYSLWPDLEADSSAFGTCPVSVFDIPMGFSLADLEASEADVLWAAGPSDYGLYFAYSMQEKQAIRDYANLGHGVVASYLLVNQNSDNSDLLDLVGIDAAAKMQGSLYTQTQATVLDPTHPLALNLPSSFQLTTHPYSQSWGVAWNAALLPGAELLMESADGLGVVVGYQGPVGRGVWVSLEPTCCTFYGSNPDQAQMVYNAVFWAGGYDPVTYSEATDTAPLVVASRIGAPPPPRLAATRPPG